MGRIIEGLWDCNYCDTKGIKGFIKQCPKCGSPQNDNTKFYIGDPHNYVSEDKAKVVNKNPDWLCSFCDSLNPDDLQQCRNCGSPREDNKLDYFTNKERKEALVKKEVADKEESETKKNSASVEEIRKDTFVNKPNRSVQKPNSVIIKRIGAGFLGLILVIALIFGAIKLFQKSEKVVTVNSVSWSRNIEIEELKTVKESDWTVPAGGRILYQQQEIRSYNHVIDHYEKKAVQKSRQVPDGYENYVSGYKDLGNGYFEEIISKRQKYRTEYYTDYVETPVYIDVPVYDTKYYYEIDKWIHTRDVKTSGNDKSPIWGTVTLSTNEREGMRSETYSIKAVDKKGKEKTYTLSFNDWTEIESQTQITIKANMLGQAELVRN